MSHSRGGGGGGEGGDECIAVYGAIKTLGHTKAATKK